MRMQWIPGLLSPSPLEGLGTRLALLQIVLGFLMVVGGAIMFIMYFLFVIGRMLQVTLSFSVNSCEATPPDVSCSLSRCF